jgi:MoaA/NifB/PqqE/SkfB family radical SAM enzyme
MLFPNFDDLNERKRVKVIKIDSKSFAYNVQDSFLIELPDNKQFSSVAVNTITPPVKTLILHTTYECNLTCKHCYIDAGEKRSNELDFEDLSRIIKEFGEMGGLCVDISGGEALLKEGIEKVIHESREQRLRTVVLTNATSLDPDQLQSLSQDLDGIAVGLDGLYGSNDKIRGDGAFNKTLKGFETIRNSGIDLSVTTLIGSENIGELPLFPEFISRYGGKNWSLVMPRSSGRFHTETEQINQAYIAWEKAKQNGLLSKLQKSSKTNGISIVLDHILVPGSKRKIEKKSRNFIYDTYNRGRACWDNTLTIMPNGDVKCCLFFDDQVYDNVKNKSLREVYESKSRKKALTEFLKYPVDKCPFVEKQSLDNFSKKIR